MDGIDLLFFILAGSFLPLDAHRYSEGGKIKVKQHHLRMSDGIDGIPHRLADLIELAQGSFIHAVPEHWKKDRRL